MSEPVVIFSTARAQEDAYQEVLDLATHYARESKKEDGVLYYNLYQMADDPKQICFHGIYEDQSALEKHRLTNHHKAWGELLDKGLVIDDGTLFLRKAVPDL